MKLKYITSSFTITIYFLLKVQNTNVEVKFLDKENQVCANKLIFLVSTHLKSESEKFIHIKIILSSRSFIIIILAQIHFKIIVLLNI